MTADHPPMPPTIGAHAEGTDYTLNELQLANRNCGIMLEMLRHDTTPAGAHYLLNHFDIPYVADASQWQLQLQGKVAKAQTFDLQTLQQLPNITRRITLECAGNGRALIKPRWKSQPWRYEAVGTAEWTGTPLKYLLEQAQPTTDTQEIVFHGADQGIDSGDIHHYGRSLSLANALHDDVLLVWAMNGQPLLPQHGFPLRLIVPGWYGMASVKWLSRIEAIDHQYQGHQQAKTYIYRQQKQDPGIPVTTMRVKSLLVPPGIPEWASRRRLAQAGEIKIMGRAWSGAGVNVSRVEVCDNGEWQDAVIDPAIDTENDRYAWCGWHFNWQAKTGEHQLMCRATDAHGNTQPIDPVWDYAGFGNNCVQQVEVWCS